MTSMHHSRVSVLSQSISPVNAPVATMAACMQACGSGATLAGVALANRLTGAGDGQVWQILLRES